MSKRFKFDGLDEYGDLFEAVGGKVYGICAKGLYEGAGVMADAIRAAVPHDSGDLADSLSITTFDRSIEGVETKILFSGYDSKGMPNPLKAAVLESGSSRGHKATHFFSKAVRAATKKTNNAIAFRIDREIESITKG